MPACRRYARCCGRLVLCRLDEGRSATEAAAEVRLTAKAVREIGWRYEDGGLE